MTEFRKKTRSDLRKERQQPRLPCRGDCRLICAALWPMHGVNLGTLLRSCEATGACLYVPHYPWVPQALSKGYTASQRPPAHWVRPDALGWLAAQRERGIRILGVELADEAIRLADLKPMREKTVMVLGHEQAGIPEEAMSLLDECVEIPMIGSGTTLNVACAGTAVLLRLAGLS